MLAIAEANVRSWLRPDARLEFHRRDFTVDPLTDLRGPSTLALVTGGTLLNFTDPVAVLRHLRHGADLLAWVARVDTVTNRTDFASSRTGSGQDIPEKSRLLLDALNVPRDC
ncbi:hypothetical protein [Actinoplanes sp. G11-F43]|uniref:hypothetical protein n=1 Tax=Actinoplanes sp. G11-F43 TaxID=3424130 RepID=UPI003D358486